MYFYYQVLMILELTVVYSFGSTIHFATLPNDPNLLSSHGFTLGKAVAFVFEVKSLEKLSVRFVKQDTTAGEDLVMRVVLDKEYTNYNQSAIKIVSNNKVSPIATYDKDIITSGVFNTFRIGWKDRVITVSKRENQSTWKTFLCAIYTPLNISDMKFVTVRTDSNAEWEVYLNDPFTNVTLPKQCPDQLTDSSYSVSTLTASPIVMDQGVMTSSPVYSSVSETLESSLNTGNGADASTPAYSIPADLAKSSSYTPNDWNSVTTEYTININSVQSLSYTTNDWNSVTTEYTVNTDSVQLLSYTTNDWNSVTTECTVNTDSVQSLSYTTNDWNSVTTEYTVNTDSVLSFSYTTNNWNSVTPEYTINSDSVKSLSYTTNDWNSVTTEYTINSDSVKSSSYTTNDWNSVTTEYSINTNTFSQTITMEANKHGCSTNNLTNCRCVPESTIAKAEIEKMINKLHELKWQRNATNSYIRSKTSASDFRSSSAAIGYFGVFILTLVAVGILLLDFPKLIQMKKKCCKGKIYRCS